MGWRGNVITRQLCAVLVLCASSLPLNPQQAVVQQLGNLVVDQPVGRDLHAGQTDIYTVEAVSGQFIRVAATKATDDMLLKVADPAGKELGYASPGTLTRSWIARDGGFYTVQLSRSPTAKAAAGYELKLVSVREATDADRRRVQADSKSNEAALKSRSGDRADQVQAAHEYEEAASVWQQLGETSEEARCWQRAGSVRSGLGEYEKALAAYAKALPLWRDAADRAGESTNLKATADLYLRFGEQARALEQVREALKVSRLTGDRSGTISLLNRIGVIYSAQGLPQQSLDYFQQSLAMARSSGARAAEADALSLIGNTYRDLGAEERAMQYYRQALSLEQSSGDRLAESNTLIAFGDATFFLGDRETSLDYYQRALALKRSIGDKSGEALTLIGLANVYSDLGARQKRSERPGPGEMQKALDYYEQALTIGRSIHDTSVEVFGRIGAGVAYSAIGDKTKALQYINQTLFIFDVAKYKPGQGWALYEKARVERDRGDLAEALKHVSASREIIESLRTNMLSQELRATFVAAVHDCHELEVDVLMRMHAATPSGKYQADAFTANERARARVLLETLIEAHADVRTGADPVLLDREKKLQAELNSKEKARIQMLAAGQTTAVLDRSIADLTAQYEELRTQIRTRNPHYAALTYPQPMSLAEIQREVLDPDTILLEYSLGEQQSYLWVISSDSINTFTLPKRTEINEAARRYREALTASDKTASSDAGKSFSKLIFGSMGEELGDKRLLIVADGALQVLPFAALPDPVAPGQPLMVNHEIVNIPSASTLGVLRRENAGRKPAPKAVAVLADPVFSADDSRFKSSLNKLPGAALRNSSEPFARSLRDAGLVGPRLPRLPGTRREAAAISALLPESERKVALDFDASYATLTSSDLAQYRTLHLATHGLLNSVHPELSGVVLSLVDRQGRPQEGFLRLHEIYNMKLTADLIVLSACQTGLGQEIRGEGLVGLTRGFLYAGAERVLASLWKVDDRATAELMRRFYSTMLGAQTLGPAAALRSAQIAMSRTKGWESPYYWAAFVLEGDWK